jgi:hypothetical protein
MVVNLIHGKPNVMICRLLLYMYRICDCSLFNLWLQFLVWTSKRLTCCVLFLKEKLDSGYDQVVMEVTEATSAMLWEQFQDYIVRESGNSQSNLSVVVCNMTLLASPNCVNCEPHQYVLWSYYVNCEPHQYVLWSYGLPLLGVLLC